MELHLTEFHLPGFLNNLAEMFQVQARQKGLAFEYDRLSNLPVVVRGDERRLRQILINLLGNAIKFTDQGQVSFKIGYHQERIRFEVEDTGVGICPEYQLEIFAPFQQVSREPEKRVGAGLGLAISRRLAEMMGGELGLESRYDQGSRFWLEVDLAVIEGWRETPPAGSLTVTGYEGRRRKVLVVDDMPENRLVLVGLLAPLGFQVSEAEGGLAAVAAVPSLEPDLIFLDLVMPGLDGYSTARQIRQLPGGQTPVIIAVSASVFEENQRRSLEAGCNSFIPKPLHLETLLQEIQTHLGLTWLYETNRAGTTGAAPDAAPDAPVLPPAEELGELLNLTLRGQIRELRAALDRLEQQAEAYEPLVTNLRRLAKEFKLKEIRFLLESYLGLTSS